MCILKQVNRHDRKPQIYTTLTENNDCEANDTQIRNVCIFFFFFKNIKIRTESQKKKKNIHTANTQSY